MKKEIIIKCRISEEEFNDLITQARKENRFKNRSGKLNFSSFLREKILSDELLEKKNKEQEFRELIYQYRKLGNNINQIAKNTNAGFIDNDTLPQTLNYMKKIYKLIKDYKEK